MIDVIRNAIEANDVYLLSIASMVRPLLFPKKVSAPPAIVPEMPADFPDCNNTVMIIDIENSTCKIFNIIVPILFIIFLRRFFIINITLTLYIPNSNSGLLK